MMPKEEVAKLKGSKSYSTRSEICGAAVENGMFSYWYDTSMERDIYDVDAYELMTLLKVETLDDLFKVIGERFRHIDALVAFLKANGLRYSSYGF